MFIVSEDHDGVTDDFILQTEVSTLSPKVGFYDHRRAVLTAENVKLKQKLIAFAQAQRLKDGEWLFSLCCMQSVLIYCIEMLLISVY